MMRLHLFPPSSRALGVVALKNHLSIDCDLVPIDLGRDEGFVLWEANAIMFYFVAGLAGRRNLSARTALDRQPRARAHRA